jgi:two-component system nitrogen regulation sensor histidine kinase GlnL
VAALGLERLAAILDALSVGIVAVDSAGRTEFQNAEASRILGVSTRTTAGRKLAELVGAEHPAAALLDAALRDRREVTARATALPRRIGGDALVVDLAVTLVSTGAALDGAVLTLADRTIGRELEALVEQRSQSERFARLASGIAHEVRNPLGGIRGAAELLLGKLDDARLRRFPELIRDETDRIRRLLDDLSQLTSARPLAFQRVDLHRTLDALLELQRHGEEWQRIELVREYDPSIPELDADPDRLSQILLNLLRNAVQAMQGKGRLVVRTRVESLYHLSPGERSPARFVHVDVDDAGPGIAPEDLPHLFTPFFSRRPGGTGLGLAIAQHWTVQHGGRISAGAAPAGGARVRVSLPVRRAS